jgi:hypothetical protein
MLTSIFELLNESACTRNRVQLNWHYDKDDDTIREFGEDIREDFPAIDFNLSCIAGRKLNISDDVFNIKLTRPG